MPILPRVTPEQLRLWMTENGYTAASLADELGVSERTVWYWRSGQRPIPPFLALALETLERR